MHNQRSIPSSYMARLGYTRASSGPRESGCIKRCVLGFDWARLGTCSVLHMERLLSCATWTSTSGQHKRFPLKKSGLLRGSGLIKSVDPDKGGRPAESVSPSRSCVGLHAAGSQCQQSRKFFFFTRLASSLRGFEGQLLREATV